MTAFALAWASASAASCRVAMSAAARWISSAFFRLSAIRFSRPSTASSRGFHANLRRIRRSRPKMTRVQTKDSHCTGRTSPYFSAAAPDPRIAGTQVGIPTSFFLEELDQQADDAGEQADALDEGGREDRGAADVAGGLGLAGDGLDRAGRDLADAVAGGDGGDAGAEGGEGEVPAGELAGGGRGSGRVVLQREEQVQHVLPSLLAGAGGVPRDPWIWSSVRATGTARRRWPTGS